MSVHCADTSALLEERVRYLPALCWPESGICGGLAGPGGTEQSAGGGGVMVPMHRGSPPRRGAPRQPLPRHPRQQGGSAHPCKFGVKLGGSLLCLVLLERAGAEHQPPSEPETNKQTPLPFLSCVCKCKHGSGNGKLGFPQPKNVKSDIRLEGVA